MITVVSKFHEPENLYEPEKVSLGTKIGRHLRRKGWKQIRASGLWQNPVDMSEHSFLAAVRLQLRKEGWEG